MRVSSPPSTVAQAGASPDQPLDEEAEARALEGKILGERYQLETLLGVGGMGAVYRAQHIHMHKTLAVKVLHRAMASHPEVIARFEREAIAGGCIEHPNVARATDFGRLDDGGFFLVLEYVDGDSLRSILAEQGALPVPRCLVMGRQIAAALAAAHAHSIVHRDLKPENIMVVHDPMQPDTIKVLDFGIAKVAAPDSKALTRVGMVFGTPTYMSPEQAMGRTVDARTDLYSLGIVLYEMLTGVPPFDADDQVVLLGMQISAPPPPLPSHVPAELAQLVLQLLEKDPALRPPSAKDVLERLDVMAPPRAASSLPGLTVPQPASLRATRPDAGSGSVVDARVLATVKNLLGQKLNVGSAAIPAWAVLGAFGTLGSLVLVVVVAAVLVAGFSDSQPAPEPSAAVPPSASAAPAAPAPLADDQVRKEVELLEQTPVYQRSKEQWLALARGLAKLDRHKDAVGAYRAALSLDRSLRNDAQMLQDFRRAASSPEALPIVINLCESRRGLGETGLDLLWDVWQSLRADSSKAEAADQVFKKLVILSRRASPSLQVAIELHAAQNCSRLQAPLERATKVADERALPRLKELQRTTGCGQSGGDDCFACLRGSSDLERAITQASGRKAPSIESGYK